MRKSLGAVAAMALLAACSSSTTGKGGADDGASAKKNAVAERLSIAKSAERLDVPLTECISFLETGSFESESLTSAGFQAQDFTFGSGTVYTMQTSEKYPIELTLVEPRSENQARKCSLNGSARDIPALVSFEDMGFDISKKGKRFLISRDETALELTGVRYLRGYDKRPNSPYYLTIRMAEE